VSASLFQDPEKNSYLQSLADRTIPDQWGQLPRLASTFDHVDSLFYFTLVVCIFFFVLITGVLGWSVVKYRRKTEDQPAASNITHHTLLEVVWTIIPLIIVMVIFAFGWKGSNDMLVVPADAVQYKALAKQWNWTFFYPQIDGKPGGSSTGELWVEVDKPAGFTLESNDVLHSYFIPAMRIKRDVVPGRFQTTWFQPTQLGTFHMFCAEYCGKDHSSMYAKVHVVSRAEWLKKPWDKEDPDPKVNGRRIWEQLCKSCHNLDATKMVGPGWETLYQKQGDQIVGQKRTVLLPNNQEVEVTVDDGYIMESIRNPTAKRAKGAEKENMTAFDDKVLPDRKVGFLLEFMKSLAK
jgi:cytochrome c oxidase subunit 2